MNDNYMAKPCRNCPKRDTTRCIGRRCARFLEWFYDEWDRVRKMAERIKQEGKF